MPKKKGSKKSQTLAGKLGNKLEEAHEEHKDDEIRISQGGDLPSGLSGVAKLTECKFDTYSKGKNKGEFFFYAHGVVLTPKSHEGIPVKGKLTKIGPIPMCDTPDWSSKQTFSEHLDDIYNELRKLGVNTNEIDEDDIGSDLERIVAELKEEQPVFAFHTWGGPTKEYPDRGVRHDWDGLAEDYEEEDEDDDDVEEDEGDEEEEEPEEDEGDEEEDESEDDDEDDEDEDEDDGEDLEELGEIADAKKKSKKRTDAQARLTKLAEKAGLDTEDYDDWSEVAQAISESSDEEEEDEEDDEDDEEEVVEPKKKDICKVEGLKSQFEVVTVNKTKETVNLKNVKSGKAKKNVPWSELVWED